MTEETTFRLNSIHSFKFRAMLTTPMEITTDVICQMVHMCILVHPLVSNSLVSCMWISQVCLHDSIQRSEEEHGCGTQKHQAQTPGLNLNPFCSIYD